MAGGHTAEMLKLLDHFNRKQYVPRCYVVAETDAMSGTKASRKEQEHGGDQVHGDEWHQRVAPERQVQHWADIIQPDRQLLSTQ
jgi:hypothetical protein